MSWKTITSLDPEFPKAIETAKKRHWVSNGAIFFYNQETKEEIVENFFDSPVVPLSSMSVNSREDVLRLLDNDNGDPQLSNLLALITPDLDYRLRITAAMEVVKDQDLMAGLCAFLIDAEARKPDQRKRLFGGLWNASRSVYFDKPLIECYEWFRKLEEKVISVFPRATFSNRVGLCCDCGSVLKLDEHEVYLFLCNSCKEQRQIQETAKESQRKLEQAAKRREKKLGLVKIFSPEQVLAYPNHFLSLALYKAYGGKCQYCLMSSVLRKSQMVIEHIIPRSLSLDAVRDKLAELGISSEQIANFCSTLLPPHHNCILNLVPSCLKHNTEKNSVLLHPAALEFMLRKAKRKAKKVLEIYSQELHRGHRKGVIYE